MFGILLASGAAEHLDRIALLVKLLALKINKISTLKLLPYICSVGRRDRAYHVLVCLLVEGICKRAVKHAAALHTVRGPAGRLEPYMLVITALTICQNS